MSSLDTLRDELLDELEETFDDRPADGFVPFENVEETVNDVFDSFED